MSQFTPRIFSGIQPSGDLHLIWLDAGDLSSPTRLRYLHARRASGEDGTRP